MNHLNTEPNMEKPDQFYEELIDLHRGLTEAQSALVNAKLILLLANHIGDPYVIRAAMQSARAEVTPPAEE
jgi:GTP1/Obg family GTP-binding protein